MSEDLAWRYVKMTCDSNNKDLEQAYLFFVTEIEPQISPINDQLNKKLVDFRELPHELVSSFIEENTEFLDKL